MNAKNVVSESKQSAKGAKMPHSFKKKKKKPLYEALSCKYTFFSLFVLCFFSVHFFSFCKKLHSSFIQNNNAEKYIFFPSCAMQLYNLCVLSEK